LELRAKFNEDRLAANLPLIDMGEGGKRALQNAIIAYRKKLQQQAQHLQDVMEGPQPDDSCRTPPSQCRRDDDPDDMDANGDSCAWPPAAKRARVC
jgi:hypothetical protein